jgi:hypothetical protein
MYCGSFSSVIICILSVMVSPAQVTGNWTGPAQLPGPSATIQKQKESSFTVIPNPGNGIYTVIFKSESRDPLTLAVSDATGKYVYLKSIRDFNGELKEIIDISGHPKGLYIFEIEGDNFRELKKVVFQ